MEGMLLSKVLHMSLIGCCSMLIVLPIRCFLQRIGRKYCYCLWLIVFLNLCIPFSIFSSFSLIPERFMGNTAENTEVSAENETENAADRSDRVALYRDRISAEGGRAASAAGKAETRISRSKAGTSLRSVLPWAEKIWLSGICLFALYSIYGAVRLNLWIAGAEKTCLSKKERIVEMKGLDSPFLWGILHPVIYLPQNMRAEERGYILAHEKCHRKRKDYLIKILIYGVTILHWFNPLVWIAYKLCCKDMEISCDESVLEHSRENIQKAYAESLFRYAVKQNHYTMTPLTFGEPSVRSRIENVLRYRKKGVLLSAFALLVTVVVAAGLLMLPGVEENNGGTENHAELSFENSEEQQTLEENNSAAGNDVETETSALSDFMPGRPCENPEKAGWNLKGVIDIRETFAEMAYVPEPGTEEHVYLIGKTEQYTLYGKGDFESMLLEHHGSYSEISYPYTSNYMTPPELLEADPDRDGMEELAIKFNIKHGTGISIDTFLLADFQDDGNLYVYQFLEEDMIAQMLEHLSYEKTADGIQALVDGQPAGYALKNDEERTPWAAVDVGARLHFYYRETGVELSAEIMFFEEDETSVVYETNGSDITAAVQWEDTGAFTLTDFESRNRYLEEQVEAALKEFYGGNEISVMDIQYDSSKMNGDSLEVSAEILPKDGDSYDYAGITMKRAKDGDSFSGWEVEEILLEK